MLDDIGPNELKVAITLMYRAPMNGEEAKAVAVTIAKFEHALRRMAPAPADEEENGDDANTAE